MYPAIQNNQNNEQGLNGFFGRMLKKALGLVAVAVKNYTLGILDFTADVDSIGEGGNPFWQKTADYEPTPAEESIIMSWVESKLAPFVGQTSKDVLDGLKNPVFATQLLAINLALKRICFLKNYYKNNEIKGLSTMAISSRLELIDQAIFPVEEIISNALKNKPVILGNQNVQYNNAEVGTLIFGSFPAYPCIQYTTNKTVPVAAVEPISAVELSEAVATVSNPANSTPETKTDKKGGWLILLALALIAIGLSGSKKEKK